MDRDPEIQSPPLIDAYGGRSLHKQSHGESFMSLIEHRFGDKGLYILDEPEAALSPSRLLSLISHIRALVSRGCQFIIATHSPILLAYPDSWIYSFGENGVEQKNWEELEHVTLTKQFLNHPQRFVDELLKEE